MIRSVAVLALILCLLQASGLVSAAPSDRCLDTCPGDGPGGDCPPFCDACVCCSAPAASPALLPAGDAGPALSRMKTGAAPVSPSSPAPREILHIPKHPLR